MLGMSKQRLHRSRFRLARDPPLLTQPVWNPLRMAHAPSGSPATHQLSVVIPAFNAATSIQASVRSAWASGAYEVIVVDDGSSDETALLSTHLGCRVISQQNAGAAQARRAGIAAARSEYVILLDADDNLIPEGVASSMSLLGSGNADVAVGSTVAVAKDGRRKLLEPWSEGVTTESLLARGSSVGPPAAAVWKRALLTRVIQDEPPALWPRFAEDYEYLIRGSLFGTLKTHNTPVCLYNMHGGKSSRNPIAGNQCAELIRRHYAELTTTSIRLRNRAELAGLAHLRLAHDHPGPKQLLRRLRHYTVAIALDPLCVPRLLLRKFRRR